MYHPCAYIRTDYKRGAQAERQIAIKFIATPPWWMIESCTGLLDFETTLFAQRKAIVRRQKFKPEYGCQREDHGTCLLIDLNRGGRHRQSCRKKLHAKDIHYELLLRRVGFE